MEDEQFYPVALVDPHLVDPFIMGIVGNIGSGKTYLTQKIIYMWRYKFDIIVWISPTYALQEIALDGVVVFDRFSSENLFAIKEHQERKNTKLREEGKPPSRMLLVLDDN